MLLKSLLDNALHTDDLIINVYSEFVLSFIRKIAKQYQATNSLHFCLICQTTQEGKQLKQLVCGDFPFMKVTLIVIDLKSVKSVLRGCMDIKHQ